MIDYNYILLQFVFRECQLQKQSGTILSHPEMRSEALRGS